MSTVASDEVLTMVSLSPTVRARNLHGDAVGVLLKSHCLVSGKRLRQSRSFDCFQQEGFCAILRQDQNARDSTEPAKNAEIHLRHRFLLADDPEIDLGAQHAFRNESLVNSPGAEYLQGPREDAQRAGIR